MLFLPYYELTFLNSSSILFHSFPSDSIFDTVSPAEVSTIFVFARVMRLKYISRIFNQRYSKPYLKTITLPPGSCL